MNEMKMDTQDYVAEYNALKTSAGVLNLSSRSRLVLTGADRVRFLHGQVTNDIKRLRVGEGCYAALTTAKGKMESDLYIYCLQDELLLDFEPGLTEKVTARLEKYIVADDVQVVDVSPHYRLLSVQGPKAADVLRGAALGPDFPAKPLNFVKIAATEGEIYVMNQSRTGAVGFDIFAPVAEITLGRKLLLATEAAGGNACGIAALETARIEAGIPRFGVDMDETSFPQECGIEERAVSYTKGCYIGQEVLNRIHTMGHVNRTLCGLRLADELKALPAKGDRLFSAEKEVGHVTSAVTSPSSQKNLALALLRNEVSRAGTKLKVKTGAGESSATVTEGFFGK
jgi:folate-binding protein YgfZ